MATVCEEAAPPCAGLSNVMFGAAGEPRRHQLAREAVVSALCCFRCPLELECLVASLEHREPAGVWGGVGEVERAELIRDRRALARIS